MFAIVMTSEVCRPQTLSHCTSEPDDLRRLACYDQLFRDAPADRADAPHSAPSGPAPAPSTGTAMSGPNGHALEEPSLAGRFWELEPGSRRGLFVVRTYIPNFLLPLHYSSDINQAPESPTHAARRSRIEFEAQEAKFQISLRAKVAQDLFADNDGLWVAYTQRSLWQLWNREGSAPFRNTDHQPEAIYVLPVPQAMRVLPGNWRWRMLQVGFAHQSNGQPEPLSRSWNRIYAGTTFEHGAFGLQARFHQRLKAHRTDDNPDLTRFIGNTEITATWSSGPALTSLTWRTRPDHLARGSLQVDWSYPVSRARPEGLRWYVQLFSGYGETLVDYNHRQSSIGLGLSLFQF